MKRLIFYTLAFLLLCAHLLKAQNASTAGVIAGKFPPTLWFNYSDYEPPHTSNLTHESGQSGGIGIDRPWTPLLPPTPSGNSTFLTIYNQQGSPSNASHKGGGAAFIKDLIPGRKYWLEYNMLSASMKYVGSDIPVTGYGTSGTLTLSNGAAGTQTIPFDPQPPLDNIGSWVPGFIEFTATSTQAMLVFTGTAGFDGGFMALDIASNGIKLACNAGTSQVQLSTATLIADCDGSVDLANSYVGSPPPGTIVAWYYTPNHVQNTLVADPSHATPGTYYAFYFDNSSNQCFNTNNSNAKVVIQPSPSKAGNQQVKLTENYLNLGSCTGIQTVNLNSLLADPTPVGTAVRWFGNASHIGAHYNFVSQINTPGTYYAFYYDANANCYNTKNSTAKVVVSEQVGLWKETASNTCPEILVNLNTSYKGTIPTGSTLVWYTNPIHKGLAVTDPTQVTTGTFYAFFYNNASQCFNTSNSTAAVEVSIFKPCMCNAGTNQVTLKYSLIDVICPSSKVSLDTLNKGNPPSATFVVWFDNDSHSGDPIAPPRTVGPGSYYAFFYDAVNNCFNTNKSTAKVTIGVQQVSLSSLTAVNTCPATTFNLNTIKVNNQPPGASLVWFKDASHTIAVADPTKVTAGKYYAFFKDNAMNCYNTDMSTSTLTVTINACQSPKVNLNLKVFLQGATTQENGVAKMRNDLQVYPTGPSTFGLLPTQDPYGGGVSFLEINSPSENKIVDWVKVEIRGMQNPSIIFESKSLLLMADGTVLDVDGFAPKFNPQFGGVRIAVKHRNHLGVVGLGLVSFNSGTVNYDFSADLSKAYNVVSKPQMILKSGVWCMIAADANSDLYIDSGDVPSFKNAFKASLNKTYNKTDLNMDGFLDSADVTIFNNNFKTGYYSSLTQYLSN